MRFRSSRAVCGIALGVAAVTAGCTPTLRTRPPPIDPRTPELASVPPSHISMPVGLDFTEVFAGVEELVPRSLGPTTEWQDVGEGAQVRFAVSRGPITLAFSGDRLVAQAEVEYAIRARKELLVMLYFQCGCAGEAWCGGANEGRRRMTLRAETRLGWSPEWHLTAQTTVPAPRAANECVLGAGPWSRNLTSLIAGEVQRRLGQVAQRELDTRVPLLTSIQSKVARGLAALRDPVPLGENRFLVLSPWEVAVSPVDGQGAVAAATVWLTAEPRIVRGTPPAADRAGLPPLAQDAPTDAFRIAARGEVPFETARRALRESLVGRRFSDGGRAELEITDAAVYGSDDDVVVRLDVTGAAAGSMYLTGRPGYDETAESIVLTDLTVTDDSLRALRAVTDWRAHAALLAATTDAARFPARDGIMRARERVGRELSRELAHGIALSVDLTAHGVTAVGTGRTGFALALVLEGRASLTVDAR